MKKMVKNVLILEDKFISSLERTLLRNHYGTIAEKVSFLDENSFDSLLEHAQSYVASTSVTGELSEESLLRSYIRNHAPDMNPEERSIVEYVLAEPNDALLKASGTRFQKITNEYDAFYRAVDNRVSDPDDRKFLKTNFDWLRSSC